VRVLMVHNAYRGDSPSGEQRVVEDECAMLREAGVELLEYFRGSDEIAAFSPARRLELPVRPIWSVEDVRRLRRVVRQSWPDLVHIHNLFPLISPGAIRAVDALGIPVVQTVHNYRHVCANGSYFRDGRICTDCADKGNALPGIVHGCYRGSRLQSVVMGASLTVHRSTWKHVRLFLPVTEFMGQHLIRMGIPADRVRIKPNSAPNPGSPRPLGRSLLYLGRLAEEKGLRALLAAWAESSHPAFDELVIAGDGPLRVAVEEAASTQKGVRYLGILSRAEVREAMSGSAAVVVPSLWFEGFPITAVESFSYGRAVIATHLGSLISAIDAEVGWTFAPGRSHLRQLLDQIGSEELRVRGAGARARYLERYTPQTVVDDLLAAYETALTTPVGAAAPGATGGWG
jgi:glycosyltransferase involved in cell wall biosynthesis